MNEFVSWLALFTNKIREFPIKKTTSNSTSKLISINMLKLIEEKDHNNVNHQEKNLGKAEILAI